MLNLQIPDLITKETAPGHREAVQISGNACKCLIAIVKDPETKEVKDLAIRGGMIQTIINKRNGNSDESW